MSCMSTNTPLFCSITSWIGIVITRAVDIMAVYGEHSQLARINWPLYPNYSILEMCSLSTNGEQASPAIA